MYKKVKIILFAVCVFIQVMTVILFGFTEFQISGYTYMAVWLICSLLIHYFLDTAEGN